MPSYLVEAYAADSAGAVDDARERARRAAELGSGIRYVRTTYLPGDETILHVFEAPSEEALERAGRRATLQFDRIVGAIERSGHGPPGENVLLEDSARNPVSGASAHGVDAPARSCPS